MNVLGADVGAIRNFVLGLNKRSREITETTARLTAMVEQIPWVGPDREAFLHDWNHVHRPGLLCLLDDLSTAAQQASRHADEQEAASADKPGC